MKSHGYENDFSKPIARVKIDFVRIDVSPECVHSSTQSNIPLPDFGCPMSLKNSPQECPLEMP